LLPARLLQARLHKLSPRWVTKILTVAHKTQRINSAFVDILEPYSNNGDDILYHIATGDGIWLLFVTAETNE
jgi:hypothetical protein